VTRDKKVQSSTKVKRLLKSFKVTSLQSDHCSKIVRLHTQQSEDKSSYKGSVHLTDEHVSLCFGSSLLTTLKERYQRVFQRLTKSTDADTRNRLQPPTAPTTVLDEEFKQFSRLRRASSDLHRHSWHYASESFESGPLNQEIKIEDIAYCGILDGRPDVLFITVRYYHDLMCHVFAFPKAHKAKHFMRNLNDFFNNSPLPCVARQKVRQSFSMPAGSSGGDVAGNSDAFFTFQPSKSGIQRRPASVIRSLQKRRLNAVSSNPM